MRQQTGDSDCQWDHEQRMRVNGARGSYCLVAQLYVTFCDFMDCSPPSSSVYGTVQARILEWVATSFSRGSSWSRDQTCISCIAGEFFHCWATREAHPFYTLWILHILPIWILKVITERTKVLVHELRLTHQAHPVVSLDWEQLYHRDCDKCKRESKKRCLESCSRRAQSGFMHERYGGSWNPKSQ